LEEVDMLTFLKKFWDAFLHDELAFRRWSRGFLLWLGGAAITVASAGWDVVRTWTLKEWLGRLAIAGILGLAGMINLGDKNPPKEEANVKAPQ
jgi:hypothetical protein